MRTEIIAAVWGGVTGTVTGAVVNAAFRAWDDRRNRAMENGVKRVLRRMYAFEQKGEGQVTTTVELDYFFDPEELRTLLDEAKRRELVVQPAFMDSAHYGLTSAGRIFVRERYPLLGLRERLGDMKRRARWWVSLGRQRKTPRLLLVVAAVGVVVIGWVVLLRNL